LVWWLFMSVINQMLRDLDKRQSHGLGQGMNIIAPARRSMHLWIVAGALLALGAGGALAWHFNGLLIGPAHSNSQAASAPAQPEVAQETAAAVVAVTPAPAEPEMITPSDSAPKVDVVATTKTETAEVVATAVLPKASNLPEIINEASALSQSQTDKPTAVKTAEPTIAAPKGRASTSAPVVHVKSEPLQSEASSSKSVIAAAAKPVSKPPVQKKSEELGEGTMEVTAVDMSPAQRVGIYQDQAEEAMSHDNPDLARRALEKVLKLKPDEYTSRIKLASLYYAADEKDRAIHLLERGVKLSPEVPALRLTIARIYIKLKQIEQAWYFLAGLEPKVADNIDYYAVLGGLAQQRGDNLAAKSSYLSLVKEQPLQGRWWLGLAIAEDRLGDYASARAAYQKVTQSQVSVSLRQFAGRRVKELEQ
jgi:MSHA biogenesis protein MshN